MGARIEPSGSPARARRPASRLLGVALSSRPYAALLSFLALLYLPWIAAIPLDGTLEGNRLEAAREMLHSGDWIVPKLGGAVYLAKPPLQPWTLALASWPLGDVSIASGRIVSALASIAACCLLFRFGRRELGTRTGLFAAFALGSSVLFAEKAVRAELESELALFTSIALLALWDAGRSEGAGRARAQRIVSGLALGAAVLVKGPPALIVFLATALTMGLWPGRHRRAFRASAASATLLGLACALVWLVPVCARLGFGSAWAAFHEQFLERIVHAGRTNVEPFWFYAPALLVGLLPATLYLPCLVAVRPGGAFASERARSRAVFLWAWALLPVILFSVSSGKETRYLLPALPAWALLVAWGWTRARTANRFLRWRRALTFSLGLATWVAPFAWLAAGGLRYPEAAGVVAASAALAPLSRAAFDFAARTGRPALLLGSLALALATAKFAWAGTHLVRQREELPVAEAGRVIASHLSPGESWTLVGPYRSWWHFAVNRPCLVVPDWEALSRLRASAPRPSTQVALVPSTSIPDSAPGLERVSSWVVDGESYSLVRLGP